MVNRLIERKMLVTLLPYYLQQTVNHISSVKLDYVNNTRVYKAPFP